MLNFDPRDTEQPTPAALRACYSRFVAWMLVGAAFGILFALLAIAPAKAQTVHTGAHPDAWAATTTHALIPLAPIRAHPVIPVERAELPPTGHVVVERRIDDLLRDIEHMRRLTDQRWLEHQERRELDKQLEQARRNFWHSMGR